MSGRALSRAGGRGTGTELDHTIAGGGDVRVA